MRWLNMTFKGLFSFWISVLPYLVSVGWLNLNNITLKVHVIETVFYQILNNSGPLSETDFQSLWAYNDHELDFESDLSFGHLGE